MQNRIIKIEYQETEALHEFSTVEQDLIKSTIAFTQNAYAPYSNFKVSAGILLENGEILHGTNVENASYPVGICAERTVLSYTISNHPRLKINTLAVYVDNYFHQAVPPCGMCRQAILEAEQRQKSPIRILLVAKNGTIVVFKSCASLLPLSFGGSFLE